MVGSGAVGIIWRLAAGSDARCVTLVLSSLYLCNGIWFQKERRSARETSVA